MPETTQNQTPKQDNPPLGRYLCEFTIQNVRAFRTSQTIDFCHPNGKVAQWTVILGENGTGKTTLLQYIASSMFVPDQTLAVSLEAKKSGAPPLRPLHGDSNWFGWHLQNISAPLKIPTELPTTLKLSKPTTLLSEALSDGVPINSKYSFAVTGDGKPKITAKFDVPGAPDFFGQFHLFAYGASRHVAGQASPYLSSDTFASQIASSTISTLLNDDYPLISPEQWLLGLDHIAKSGGTGADMAKLAFESACRCLARALPDIQEITVAPFGFLAAKKSMMVLCKTHYSRVPLPFNSLGTGYRTMASWITDFLRKMFETYYKLSQPNTGPAIVLIDEFDLHMHPHWQRNAMKALSAEFPNTQFIITAHSPLVVQATEGTAKLIVLRPRDRNDGTREVKIDGDQYYAAGWRVDQILSSGLYDQSPRSEKYTELMKQRTILLQKISLTSEETDKLKSLEEQLNREAPPGESNASKKLYKDVQNALRSVARKNK